MRRRRGFTLVELIVVAGLLAVLAVLLAKAWRSVGRTSVDAVARGRVLQEANLAVAALQRELVGSRAGSEGRVGDKTQARYVGRLQPENAQLWLCFDGGMTPNGLADWAAPDAVIVYRLESDRLVRWDQTADTTFTVARHVSAFEAIDLGSRVQLRLTFSYRGVSRTFTLVGCDP